MCGITGYASLSGGNTVDAKIRKRIENVLNIMSLRGPDGKGITAGKNWILGHRRLAVIDPVSGLQPMLDEKSGAAITYNGEVYNFRELRNTLSGKGYSFSTDCDTEVVLKSYLEWGEKCVEKFNGFFAFAIADPRTQKLFVARDRIGIKPLFYYCSDKIFCFCSSIPGIKECAGTDFDIDTEALSHYLTTGKSFFGTRTLWDGIRNLRPGHLINVDMRTGRTKIKPYWKRPVLTPEEKEDSPGFESAAEQVRMLLENSVEMRLISDVPLGAFMSGGLDSSIIAWAAKTESGMELPIFCAGTDDESSNEFKYARIMAESLHLRLREIRINSADFSKDWAFLISQKGLPLCTPNEISIYKLASALRESCTVTLTGEGADEIFGGYIQPHFSAYDFDRSHCSAEDASKDLSPFSMAMTMLYGRNYFIDDTDHYTATSCWFPWAEKARLFQTGLWESIEEDNDIFAFYSDFFDSLSGASSFDKRMHLHAEFNLENLLSRIDNCTMSASVEARVPFNDHRLVEFAFTLPDSYKMNWRSPEAAEKGKELTSLEIDRQDLIETKRLPRHAFESVLPKEIIERKKMSFPVPFTEWFYGPMFDEIKELCLSSKLCEEFFNRDYISSMFEKKDRNLWLIANLCKWHSECF